MNTERVEPTCKRVTMCIKGHQAASQKHSRMNRLLPSIASEADTSKYDHISISEGEMLSLPEVRANHNKAVCVAAIANALGNNSVSFTRNLAVVSWERRQTGREPAARINHKVWFHFNQNSTERKKNGTVARGHRSGWNNSQSATLPEPICDFSS